MALKFSVCIEMIFRDLPFLDRISAAAEAGYSTVEFWSWRNKDMSAVADKLAEEGVAVAAFLADCGKGLWDPDTYKDWIKGAADYIDQAVAVGATGLIATTGNELTHIPRDQQHEAVVEGLKAIAPYAEEKNITLSLEPLNVLVDHAGYYLVTSEQGFQVIDEVGSPQIKLLYDIYHQQITEGNILATICANMDKIGHLHVADVPGRQEPGTGELNYQNIFSRIADSDYQGYVGLEFKPSTTSEEALAKVLKIAGLA